ncbi:caspase-3-like [Bradysia coprophila]|uniref:caspase-3-like n=1 Tax=Bradysia coprophila TaxID=38358 RepID=UPI00187DBD65|nr:caspase-3-like [Bradysia coprophila]XP_037049608.1 caspase-3-like [Bradysia coprophila]
MGKIDESNTTSTKHLINLQDLSTNEHLYSQSKGLLMVFNQVNFHDGRKYKPRTGANLDLNKIRDTFSHFSFKVEVRVDLTVKEIFSVLYHLPLQHNLQEFSSLMVVFLTYGEGNDKIMASDHPFSLKDIANALQPNKIEELTGKPKIIMINASRGNKLNKSVSFNPAGGTSDGTPTDSKISTSVAYNLENYALYDKDIGCGYSGFYPLNADFLFCYSTYDNHLSFRNEYGSWFIQEFCDVLDSNKESSIEIMDVLTTTCRRMAKRRTDSIGELDNIKQVPMFTSTLTRKFLFLPKSVINYLKSKSAK